MKQKLSVRGIIKRDGKVLLGRRIAGKESLRGFFELPGGEVPFGTDPTMALQKHILETLGVEVQTVQLSTVVSEVDNDNQDVQYVVIVYLASLSGLGSIEVRNMYDKYVWKKMSDIQQETLTSITAKILGFQKFDYPTPETLTELQENVANKSTMDKKIVYCDGGSRGNPGPSAAGFVVMNTNEIVVAEGGKYLGITTNNQAEYQAVLLGLTKARELGAQEVEFRLDSLMVVNQMNGLFHIKNRELWPIHARIQEATRGLKRVRFIHVKREFNSLADAMVNKILDQEAVKQT